MALRGCTHLGVWRCIETRLGLWRRQCLGNYPLVSMAQAAKITDHVKHAKIFRVDRLRGLGSKWHFLLKNGIEFLTLIFKNFEIVTICFLHFYCYFASTLHILQWNWHNVTLKSTHLNLNQAKSERMQMSSHSKKIKKSLALAVWVSTSLSYWPAGHDWSTLTDWSHSKLLTVNCSFSAHYEKVNHGWLQCECTLWTSQLMLLTIVWEGKLTQVNSSWLQFVMG